MKGLRTTHHVLELIL